jgi:hypothetical protein
MIQVCGHRGVDRDRDILAPSDIPAVIVPE